MSYETLVIIAKTFGPIWMMGFFIIVIVRTYNPKRRAEHERAARSILIDQTMENQK